MFLLHSFAAVNTTLVPIFKKLSLLLAILLCGILAMMVPATAIAVPAPDTTASELCFHSSDDTPFLVVAGEVSSGELEGVLQKGDKALLAPFGAVLIQLLYSHTYTEAIPAQHPFHSGSTLLYSILTKGP